MKRVFVSLLAAAALMTTAGSSAALAAQKKCNCKPSLQRKSRTTRARVAPHPRVTQPDSHNGSRVEVLGPIYTTYTLPQNQYFRLRMNQTLSSETARMGDRFRATVVTPVYASGVEVVPAGSIVEGRVTGVTPARSRGREGQIAIAFDTLILPDGLKRSMDGVLTELQDEKSGEVDAENEVSGRDDDKRKLIYIGGGGAGGAILGGAIGGGKGAAIGAVLGAGAGVAGVMLTKGHEAELRSGTELGMTTTSPIVFSVRSYR